MKDIMRTTYETLGGDCRSKQADNITVMWGTKSNRGF
jgi:hypothetical protein